MVVFRLEDRVQRNSFVPNLYFTHTNYNSIVLKYVYIGMHLEWTIVVVVAALLLLLWIDYKVELKTGMAASSFSFLVEFAFEITWYIIAFIWHLGEGDGRDIVSSTDGDRTRSHGHG